MAKTVLITGGSGLIGKHLTSLLLNSGYQVNHLSRKASQSINNVKVFKWHIESGEIDEQCIDEVDAVVHLAGEGIASKPWRNSQKEKLIKSRVDSINLLYSLLKSRPSHKVKTIISASGVGYYGNRGDELLNESSSPGTDFMAHICVEWEKAADEGRNLGLRVSKLRTGVVLTSDGGALPQIAAPIKAGFGAPLGKGTQWMPWIYLDDLISLYKHALENENMEGVFNAASPNPVTNEELTKAIAQQLNKPLWLPKVPEIFLRLALGEMSTVLLNSTKTTSNKVQEAGFKFTVETVQQALKNIYAG